MLEGWDRRDDTKIINVVAATPSWLRPAAHANAPNPKARSCGVLGLMQHASCARAPHCHWVTGITKKQKQKRGRCMLRRLHPWPGLCSGVRACVVCVVSLKATPPQKNTAGAGNRNRGTQFDKNLTKRKRERKNETCSLPRFVHSYGGAKHVASL